MGVQWHSAPLASITATAPRSMPVTRPARPNLVAGSEWNWVATRSDQPNAARAPGGAVVNSGRTALWLLVGDDVADQHRRPARSEVGHVGRGRLPLLAGEAGLQGGCVVEPQFGLQVVRRVRTVHRGALGDL